MLGDYLALLSDSTFLKTIPAIFRGNNYDCLISIRLIYIKLVESNCQKIKPTKRSTVSYRSDWLIQSRPNLLGPAQWIRSTSVSALILNSGTILFTHSESWFLVSSTKSSSPFGDQAPNENHTRRFLKISHLTIRKLRNLQWGCIFKRSKMIDHPTSEKSIITSFNSTYISHFESKLLSWNSQV